MGFLKKVGKVFKKVVKSKIFKIAMIAAAVYFTAGIGLAASGSAFAAGLPGIQTAASLFGVTGGALGGAAGAAASAAGMASIEGSMLAGIGGETALAGSTLGASGAAVAEAAEIAAGAGESVSGFSTGIVGGGSEVGGTFAQQAGQQVAKTAGSNALQKAFAPGGGAPSTNVEDQPWFSSLSQGAKESILASGISGAAKAGLGAIASNSAQKSKDKQYEQDRKDAIRRGGVPDITQTYRNPYKTPGIINQPGA